MRKISASHQQLHQDPASQINKSTIFFPIVNSFLYFESRFSHKIMAAIYMVISCILFSFAAYLTKISSDVPPGQLIWNRAFYEMLMSLIAIYIQKGEIYTSNASTNKLLLITGAMIGLSMTLYFRAVYYLPISICAVLFMLNPLWIGLATSLKERKFDRWTFCILLISIAGMILIIKPGFRGEAESESGGSTLFYIGVFIAFMTSITSSIGFIANSNLKGKIQTATIVLYFDFAMIFYSAFSSMFEGVKVLTYWNHFVLFSLGFMAWFGQMARARAFLLEKTFIISVLMYSQIAFSYIADVCILKIEIDMLSNMGCVMIGCAMVGLIYKENRGKE